jgi:hypothetical protein
MSGRLGYVVVGAVVACLSPVTALAGAHRPAIVSSTGVAGVRFGLPEAQVVAQLSRAFGSPSRPFPNSGCGRRYKEVAWGHLYAEFRDGRFSGFRYMTARWLPQRVEKSTPSTAVRPKLTAAKGVTLGSTLGQLRARYGRLDLIGTDRWKTPDGLVFYDSAKRAPPSASSRVVEIKFGTCADF